MWSKYLTGLFVSLMVLGNIQAQEGLKMPVVVVHSELPGALDELGTGIITGERDDALYILTARHVILPTIEHGGSLEVTLRGRGPTQAEVIQQNASYDLAVIAIRKPLGLSEINSFLPASRLPDPESAVTLVGHPQGNQWDINRRGRIKSQTLDLSRDFFTLYPDQVKNGHSGGPVLNRDQELIGMVLETSGVRSRCLHVDFLIRACQFWGIPMNYMTGIPGAEGGQVSSPKSFTDPQAGEMIWIPAGSFNMGRNNQDNDEAPPHRVTLDSFWLGKHEVTVEQFESFVLATGYQTTAELEGGSYAWDADLQQEVFLPGVTWQDDESGNTLTGDEYNHPVIHISWEDAKRYCEWISQKTGLSASLPTEAQWEYAAGNLDNHTKYSWGNRLPTPAQVGPVPQQDDESAETSRPVGSFESNSIGLHDMSGNVWEWCWDSYQPDYYQDSPEHNPQGPAFESFRVIRGGSWQEDVGSLRVTNRGYLTPDRRYNNVGFRIVILP